VTRRRCPPTTQLLPVFGTRAILSSTSSAIRRSSAPSERALGDDSVNSTMGTSSISTGLTIQLVTPAGTRSWLDMTLFQTFTRLRSRSSPTKKRTVTTASPGRDIE